MPGMLEHFPEHARIIGCLIAEWTHVEYRLILMLALASHAPNDVVMPMLYAVQSSKGRLEAMQAAYLRIIPDEPRRTQIMEVLDRARSLLTMRDKYAHALYGWYDPDGPHETLSIIGQGSRVGHDLPLYDLQHQYRRKIGRAHV